jgi:hypothetical protein
MDGEHKMSTTIGYLPEDVLLATLHKVGSDVRLVDGHNLAKLFNEAAKDGGPFTRFAWHRHYHVSELLSRTLQVLDHAGSIVRENAAQTYFRVSPHAAGPYGKAVFESLPMHEQSAIEALAARIKSEFEEQHGVARVGG